MKHARKIWFGVVLLGWLSGTANLFATVSTPSVGTPEPAQVAIHMGELHEKPLSFHSLLAAGCGLLLVSAMAMVTVAPLRDKNQSLKTDANDRDEAGTALNDGSLYREIFEQADELIYVTDLTGKFVCMNPAGLKLLGYTAAELSHLTLTQVVAPEYRARLNQLMQVQRTQGKSTVFELTLVARDGHQRTVQVSSRVQFKAGQATAIQNIARDITEHKQVEARWSAGNSLLEVLLENTPDFIYFKDRDSHYVRSSKALLSHLQLTDPAELAGKTDVDFFNLERAEQSLRDEQEVMRTGQPIVGKQELVAYRDSRVKWVKTTKMPWRDKEGHIVGTFGVSSNISRLKDTEEKLAAERELLRTLLGNVPERIYFKDLESRFVHASTSKVRKTLERLPQLRARLAQQNAAKGLDPADCADGEEVLIGLTDFDLYTEEHAQPAFSDEQEIIRTGRPIAGKLEKETHFDGSITWSLSSKMAWRDKDGNIIGTFGLSRDITELKKAENELAMAHKRLLETSRLAGMAEVATDVLHNVGNVLNSVNVSCSLVLERIQETNFSNLAKVPQMLRDNAGRLDVFLTTDPRGKHITEFLAVMAQNIDDQRAFTLHELTQLRNHIDHIKHVVNMQQSYAKVTGVEEVMEVSLLIEDALQINSGALDRHQIELKRELEPLPPVLVDKHKVLQILVNLIRNAKYALTEVERKDKVLIVRVNRTGEEAMCVQVIDNGMGIAPENLNRIFGHGFTTRRDGHGFGLHSGALAAREMGGSLSVHSEGLGKGATFTLELPIRRSAQTEHVKKS